MDELRCPVCGARLRYTMSINGSAEMLSNGVISEHGHITEKVTCNVCGDVNLPSKLVDAMKKKCRMSVLLETAKWRML